MNAFYRHFMRALRCLPPSTRMCSLRRAMHISAKLSCQDQDIDNGTSSDSEELDALLAKYPYKTVLIPDVSDAQLQRLLSSETPSELFSSVSELGTPCPLVYAAQAIVSLWDLKKLTRATNETFDAAAVLSSPGFDSLVDQLQCECGSLTNSCLTAVLVSLKRLLQEPSIPIYHTLLREAASRCSSFNLQDLSRFIVSLNQSRNVNLTYQCLSISRLQELLPSCSTEQDFKCAAISLRRLLHLSSPSLIATFCGKAFEILTPASHAHTLLRSLPVICNEPQGSFRDSCMSKVLTYVDPLIASLDVKDLSSLANVVSDTHCNASNTIKLIQERALQLFRQAPSVSLVHSLVMGPRLQQPERHQIESSLHQILKAGLSHRSVTDFADIVTWLPVSSFSLLSAFWNAAADLSNPSLMILIRRYLSCYHQTRFRSESFESVVLEWSKEELESSWKLAAVALAAQFLLTFRLSELSSENVCRLSSLSGRFRNWSLLELSLGLKAAERASFSKLRSVTTLSPALMDLKTDIHRVVSKRVETVEDLAELTVLSICSKVLWSSRGHNIQLKECIATRSAALMEGGSPRSLASFCKVLTAERLWLPDYLNRLVARAVEKPDWLFPITLCHLPYACFISGLVPDKAEQLAKVVSPFVLSNFDDLPTPEVLQTAVALGFFQCLGSDLIQRIFALPFMERLDRELTRSVGNERTDHHVRELLATLNRIACLDFPEEHVPWFHDQFYATRAVNARRHLTALQKDVQDNLEHVLGGSQFVQRHVFAPYGYLLQLSCELDAAKTPVPFSSSTREHHRLPESQAPAAFHRAHKRIAVLVLGEKSFCENYPQITGYQQLKIRHLEILGYQLVLVPFYEWNSMKLAESSAKQDYLHGKIFGIS
ncbi:FAST kinase domain-containing protein 1, mitochondrial-like [Rhipicephalus sanguineus]|uniref:FAST kinase domain-containing protein 1, mitochondrial-like n=1 Tax=Rhipicephalus sanguineus TaxID=34632 RepID=UPI0018941076|nr:FAST kinase domain-containing protein 1, mitochondrial-like [Rhipicephalus sanguineus]